MTERSDITYFWVDDPRVAEVQDPSVGFVLQDIVDTFRANSADIGGAGLDAIDDDALLSEATGKDDLGGGVLVGITATGNRLQIAFQARTTPISTAVVTTGDSNGKNLIASGGSFQTDLVTRGKIVINYTDESMGSVLTVDGEGDLTIDGLTGGTDNQFDIGDSCKIYDVVQCEIDGGNWVSVDINGDPIDSILPTFGTQIVRTSSSSATLQELTAIQHSSFDGGITIDVANKSGRAVSGTVFPIGTSEQPVDNILDAIAIADDVGLFKFFILGDITFTTGHNLVDYIVEGESQQKSLITVDSDASVVGAEFEECTLQGALDSNTSVKNSTILNLEFFEGFFHNCAFEGTIILGGSNDTHLIDCRDATPGGGPLSMAVIDMGGSGRGLIVRNFAGGLKLINKIGTEEISIGIGRGRVELDSTVTNGDILVRIGAGRLTDNSTGATVTSDLGALKEELLNGFVDTIRIIESQRGHHTGNGTVFYWDPVNGNDANDGLTSLTAKLTWGSGTGVNSLIIAHNHDTVIIIPGEVAGTTRITEQIDVDKGYIFMRGTGRDILFKPTATTGATVSVSAEGVELSGIRIETADTGDGEALIVNGEFGYIHDLWIELSQGDGIRLNNTGFAKMKDIHIRNCVGDAIVFRGITQDCKYNVLSDAFIISNGGNGVVFEGANCQQNYVWGGEDGITIMGNTGWGVLERGFANANHVIGPTIHIDDNIAGGVNLTGTLSASENIEQWAIKTTQDTMKLDILRMLGLANENTSWSDMTWDTSVNPPRILTGKVNLYIEETLTTRLTDGIGNVVYQFTQAYNEDGSTSLLNYVRTT